MSIVELSGPPGDMPPLHLHRTDDEAWYVLEGGMSFFVGTNEPVRVGADSLAFGPKRVPHTAIAIHRIADGKIVEHWSNKDELAFLQQLGVIPQHEPAQA